MKMTPCKNCDKCPRLLEFREQNKLKFPDYFNAPVPSFGQTDAELLVVGLAPGLNGANKTGRPFTNDYAGDILYPTLKKFGLAKGNYLKNADDGFELVKTRITNAVRCVPPQNKVTGEEICACNGFLIDEISSINNLRVILTLGSVAHNAILKAFNYKQSQFKFAHNSVHFLKKENIYLVNSYHTSRYNINTNRLTQQMFDEVVQNIVNLLEKN